MKNKLVTSMTTVQCIKDCLMYKISAHSLDVLISSVYMPISDCDDLEVEVTYEEISEILHQAGKGVIMRDDTSTDLSENDASRRLGCLWINE